MSSFISGRELLSEGSQMHTLKKFKSSVDMILYCPQIMTFVITYMFEFLKVTISILVYLNASRRPQRTIRTCLRTLYTRYLSLFTSQSDSCGCLYAADFLLELFGEGTNQFRLSESTWTTDLC